MGLFIDMFVLARCNGTLREQGGKHLESTGIARAGSFPPERQHKKFFNHIFGC